MKRVAILAIALVALAGFVGESFSAQPRWVSERLSFRTSAATTLGYVDSTAVRWGSGVQNDTTVAFSLYNMFPAQAIWNGNAIIGSDSIPRFTITFQPTASSPFTNSIDTVWVTTQVSMDGRNWTTDTTITGVRVAASNQLSCAATSNVAYYSGGREWNSTSTTFGFPNATRPRLGEWHFWKYARLLTMTDGTGEFEATLNYLTGQDDNNNWGETPHLATARLLFRNACLGCYAGYIDSSYTRNAGTSNATRDTTAPIPLKLVAHPSQLSYGNLDSIYTWNVVINPTASTSVTTFGDSIYLYVQVSNDGRNWINVTGATEVLMVPNLIAGGNTQTYQRSFKTSALRAGAYASGASAAPTHAGLVGWNYIRFIIRGDYNGEWEGFFNYWAVADR